MCLTPAVFWKRCSERFDIARESVSRAAALYDDPGLKVMGANPVQNSGFIEMLAGDPVADEAGYELLDDMGERGFLSTIATLMADALYDQMRFGEAEHFTHVSEEAAALDGVMS